MTAGGIHPGYYAPAKGDITGQLQADALLSVTPPPQMPATLEAGTIYATASVNPGTSRRSSKASAFRSSLTTKSGKTIRKKPSV
jgi:hypothetical protein